MGRAGDVAAGAGRGVAGAFRQRDQSHITGNRCRLMASATQPSDPHGSISLRIRGGVDAPSRARRWVLSLLDTNLAQTTASDVALAVSELVTNSVLHAKGGPRRTLTVEFMTFDDRLRISVIDPGSPFQPRIRPPDPERVGGMGLFIINELSEAWGVARDGTEATRVWCDILVHRPRSSQLRVVDSESASVAPS
jgi:anti-sigma regulatory factor (Ser/Thr protein kinase)